MRHQIGDRRPDVNHQVGQLDKRHHEVKQVCIILEIAVAHPHVMQIGREDTGILKDGAVLHHRFGTFGNFDHIPEPLVEEIDLQIKRPPLHIGIIVGQIRIVVHRFEVRMPAVSLGEHLGQRSLAAAYITFSSIFSNLAGFLAFSRAYLICFLLIIHYHHTSQGAKGNAPNPSAVSIWSTISAKQDGLCSKSRSSTSITSTFPPYL